MEQPVLQVAGISKNYGSLKALTDFKLEVRKGQIYGILGPNGSGKTTALAILLGILRPSAGTYSWFGQGQAAQLRRRVGSLLEHPYFYPHFSLEQNLSVLASIRGIDSGAQESRRVLQLVDLQSELKTPFSACSLGMKQRFALAATMLGNPEVLVLDEPTNGIDAEGIVSIRNLLLQLAESGTTILLASHILDEVEKTCSHVIILKQGLVVDDGLISEVLSQEDQVEMGAANLELLKNTAANLGMFGGLHLEGGFVLAKLKQEIDLAELNQQLAQRGVHLNHLRRKHKSLEAHFLSLLDQ